MATAVFNGLGDSKTPLGLLIFSSLFNVVLDILFVAGFHWGVAGVAWATFIAQGLSSILAFLILIRRLRSIQTEGGYPKFSWHTLGKIAVIAVPSILQQSIVSVGQLAVQALVNGFGAAVIAGYSAAIKIDSFFKMTIMSMGNAMSSFTAQNMGAGKPERVGPGKKAALLSMLLYAVVSLVLVVFFGQYMIGLFADTSEDAAQVIAVGTQYMLIVSGGYLIYAVLMVYNGILRGAGYMLGFTTVTLTDLICRVGFSYLLAWITQSDASIWWAIPIGWGVGAVLALLFYYKGNWQRA
ncbi:MAG TPA: polysaccharide biosynthesis C-terminal domain-containing protein, partial [Firmicutes bacterium]|nr:polysaccharide biosynthesis C-terminal domain-containing protein [Bacillota bacterium]